MIGTLHSVTCMTADAAEEAALEGAANSADLELKALDLE
jgi:hypothetical protein